MAASEEKPHALVKAVMTLSKGKEVHKETELLMKPYANWEEFLMPAPISIAILGELIFISTGQGDFSINKLPPLGGFQHLKYPESFKASLCQVSNRGWIAFNEAHVNMDQIRLLASGIPGQMKTIVRTLIQEAEVVTALLPNQLKNLQAATEQCGGLAKAVRAKFTDVINLIQELLEACLSAKQGYEKELEEVKIALEQARIRDESAKEAKEMAGRYHQHMKEQVEESFQQYKEAMASIPTGWDAVGMELVTTLTQTLSTFSIEFSRMLAGGKRNLGEAACAGSGAGLAGMVPFISASVICSKSAELLTFASSLKNLLDGHGGLKASLVLDEKSGAVKTEWVKRNFQRLRDSIEKEEGCDPKVKAQEICQAGLEICQQLEKLALSVGGIGKAENLQDAIHQLHKKASEFYSYSKNYTRSPSFSPKPPNISKMGEAMYSGVENAHLKVQQSREVLRATREEYQRSFENFKKQNEELTEILCTMRGYQVKEVDFDTARKMLIKGLEALGRVKEQWEKMVRFFQMISNLIESCLVWSIKEFADTVDGAQKISSYSSKAFTADLVYGHVFNASSMAQLVAMISETYTLVSEKYLMERVSSLGRLLTM
ncbi:ATP synthase epsilon chain, chloroplastic [Varanus komodoensis]|nr:ATP synthase epsilon chain, chloroplastic [Varanus komodoensis]